MKVIRHIIWDWNGTILDDVAVCVEVLNQVLIQYGKSPTTLQQYRLRFGFPVQAYYESLGFDFQVESYASVADDYIGLYRRRQFDCRLHEHATEVLMACQALGLGQSILSAYHQDLLDEVVTHFGLRPFFQAVFGRDDHYAASKTDRGLTLVRELSLDPSRVLMVGDTTHDAEVALSMGVHCVLVGNGHQEPRRLAACGAPVLESIRQIVSSNTL